MQTDLIREPTISAKVPWNKGKMIGAKPPLRIKNVWSIRTKLQVDGHLRDLPMFNLAIDSKLRGCDVVALRVEDIAPHGAALDRATVRQKKTGHPVRFELTEQTREAIDAHMRATERRPGDYLFPSRRFPGRPLTTRRVRPARFRLDYRNRLGCQLLWYPLAKADQGHPHLQAHWQSPSGAAPARPPQNREHRPIPRDRGR